MAGFDVEGTMGAGTTGSPEAAVMDEDGVVLTERRRSRACFSSCRDVIWRESRLVSDSCS